MLNRKLINSGFVGLLSAVLLQGCAQTPKRAASEADGNALNSAQVAPELKNLSQGDLVEFDSGLLAPFGKVTIGREYHSASGRQCKQILNLAGDQMLSIVCSLSGERWYARKPLSASSMNGEPSKKTNRASALLVPAVQDTAEPEAIWSDRESVMQTTQGHSEVLQQNETLWSFSKRTTGSGLNWKAIATHNRLDDAHIVNTGDTLVIPASLSKTVQ